MRTLTISNSLGQGQLHWLKDAVVVLFDIDEATRVTKDSRDEQHDTSTLSPMVNISHREPQMPLVCLSVSWPQNKD